MLQSHFSCYKNVDMLVYLPCTEVLIQSCAKFAAVTPILFPRSLTRALQLALAVLDSPGPMGSQDTALEDCCQGQVFAGAS